MKDLWKELERTCERATHELSQLNDRLETNKNMMSPADLEIMFKLMDIVKDTKSTMKKIIEIEDMEQMDGEYSGYSGNMMYRNEPMWDRRYSGANNGNGGNYSGNSYKGAYTLETGDGYSGRRMGRRYSGGDDTRMELEEMLNSTRDPQEAEVLRKVINKL